MDYDNWERKLIERVKGYVIVAGVIAAAAVIFYVIHEIFAQL